MSEHPRSEVARRLAALALGLVLPLCGADGEPAPPAPAPAPAAERRPEVEALIDAIEARYAGVRDLRARFEQESRIASLERSDRSSGRVLIQRPGRMRWEYGLPEPRVIAVDGDVVRIYDPGERQLQVAPLGQGALSPTALDFLLGRGSLRGNFTVERLEPGEGPGLGLRLRPLDDAGFESLELWVAPQTYQIRASVLRDLFGNRTHIRFIEVSENSGVEEGAFTVSVPDGTDVIDLR
jgi:outer membrane lipoprotein carrier protein